ncbi:3'-5' exonuclease [Silvimonas soli]|uniref:3'-5' exonuclease n=1 Tax=Silvimonas soli TaxID=2980100 RepID=UPI0024B33100|nr:3'-5' exonuclease [Silvimonas soli]
MTGALGRWREARRVARLRKQLRDPAWQWLLDPPPADEYVSLDCETTSLDRKHAELLSIAAVKISGQRIETSSHLQLLVRPQGEISHAGIPIHQLRAQDVAQGLTPQAALEQLLQFIGSRPIVGYYLEFDLAILNRYVRPWLGINLPNPVIEVSGLYYDRKVTAWQPEVDLSLPAICNDLQLPQLPRHDPFCDAVIAALIFLKLQRRP